MDCLYERIQDDIELYSNTSTKGESQIQKFYAGKTIFVTGCTGFIGKCLVEKLLRTCTEIKTIYVLIRPKRGVTVETRLEKYFQNIIFQRVLRDNPDVRKKVVPIQGDLKELDLGLSPEDRSLLIKNSNIIIHNGATVSFNETVSNSLKINVLSTQKMLELGEECTQLDAFLYISTAFSHLNPTMIKEECVPPPADLKMIQDMIKADNESPVGLSEEDTRAMLGDCLNIYIFTKATAEGLVEKYAKKARFPCAIFRPSVVVSTITEPIKAWCGNKNGPVMLTMSAALGFVHTVYGDRSILVDFVPVDMTSNAILAVIWDLISYKKPGVPHVYNYGSGEVNCPSLLQFKDWVSRDFAKYPSIKAVWHFFVIDTNCLPLFYALHILFHIIPAALLDLFLLIRWKKIIITPLLRKVNKNISLLETFLKNRWRIQMKEMYNIWDRMNAADRELFHCDLRELDWKDYTSTYWRGIRFYVLKESQEEIPAARRKYKMLMILHYAIVTMLISLCAYFMYRVISF